MPVPPMEVPMESFEIRLVDGRPQKWMLFATLRETDTEAVQYARHLLDRYPDFLGAEVWKGMKMVWQI